MQKAFATTLALLCLWLPARSQQQTIDQLDRYIRPISQLQADSSFADLEFLGETLKGKTIIGLGEATQGTKEIFAYKDKLIRFMVERLGHRTIAFEADHAGLQSVDDYINGKTDQAPMSVHYRPLFDWLRVFNKTISTKEKVHLYGLEMRSFAPAISRLLNRIQIWLLPTESSWSASQPPGSIRSMRRASPSSSRR